MNTNKESIPKIYLIVIFFIAVIAIIIVFSSYYFTFEGNVSTQQNIWGAFGDYIGGILNPILSFLALIALLVTISIQNKQLYLSRKELELTKLELSKTAEAAQRQANYFEQEARRSDIYRIIEILSTRVNNNYNENRIDPALGTSEKLSLHFSLKKGSDATTNKYLQWIKNDIKNKNTDTYRTLNWVENDLLRLAHYITSYDEVSATKELNTPLREFYRGEFGQMVFVLYNNDLLPEKLYSYYCE